MMKKVDKISSNFVWDAKSVVWEIKNIWDAVGLPHSPFVDPLVEQNPVDPQEYNSMLDIDFMNSVTFDAGDHDHNRSTWRLTLYKSSPDHLGLFMHLITVENESALFQRNHHSHSFDNNNYEAGLYLKYNMSILNKEGEIFSKIENLSVISITPGQAWGEDELLHISHLWDPELKLLTEPDNTLCIKLDIFIFADLSHSLQVVKNELQTEKRLGLDGKTLRNLWQNKDFADVKIYCGEKAFDVHKCVIAAASPVFKAMFSTNMAEAKENKVKILDLEYNTLEILLSYFYNQNIKDRIEWKDTEKVAELVDACEKYQVNELKSFCFSMLCHEMELKNVGRVAVLGKLYNAEVSMMENVYKFIIRNIKILRTDSNFMVLLSEQPSAFAPILLSDALFGSICM